MKSSGASEALQAMIEEPFRRGRFGPMHDEELAHTVVEEGATGAFPRIAPVS